MKFSPSEASRKLLMKTLSSFGECFISMQKIQSGGAGGRDPKIPFPSPGRSQHLYLDHTHLELWVATKRCDSPCIAFLAAVLVGTG